MDIWKWVGDTITELQEAGNDRLAGLIHEISSNVCEGRQELAEAALPEALAGARAIKHPWLEVYFRHWVMNGRVARRLEGESALRDTVALFEFAHRDDTINCPQSICVTQDIAICYGIVDGPGYAPERIAVCEETLARIDPTWACFTCISCELMDALVDAGRAPEAVALARRQMLRLEETGGEVSTEMQYTLAHALFAMHQHDSVLELLDAIDAENEDEDAEQARFDRASLRFRALAAQGKHAEAMAMLPQESDDPRLRDNEDIVAGLGMILAALPKHNDFVAGRRTFKTLRRYCDAGAHRYVMNVLGHHVRLAVARGARWSAQEALAMARPHLDRLRAPLGAPEQFAELEALVAGMQAVHTLPVPAEDLVAHLVDGDSDDAEKNLELLLLATSQRPDDPKLALLTAQAMRNCGGSAQARAWLWRFVRSYPQSHVGAYLLDELISEGDDAAVVELAKVLQAEHAALAHWCLARLAFVRKGWDEVEEQTSRILELVPGMQEAKRMRADAALRAKRFDEALTLYQELADLETEPGDLHWDVLVAATCAQRWDEVRRRAAQLGMELAGTDGPVDETWGRVRFQYVDGDRLIETYGWRTGPVTGRVTSLSRPGTPQYFGDVAVFQPIGLEQRPDDEEERQHFVQKYEVAHVMTAGGLGPTFEIEGVSPGEEEIDRMVEELEALNCACQPRNADDYMVEHADTGEQYPGLYMYVAAPATVPLALLHEKLTAMTAAYAHPLCWPKLAEAAGADAEAHWSVLERYLT